jgi:hypothetical protein
MLDNGTRTKRTAFPDFAAFACVLQARLWITLLQPIVFSILLPLSPSAKIQGHLVRAPHPFFVSLLPWKACLNIAENCLAGRGHLEKGLFVTPFLCQTDKQKRIGSKKRVV